MVENWDQYEDLEYYPDRVCKCGCRGKIKVKQWHKYQGIPIYIKGHYAKTIKKRQPLSEEHKKKFTFGGRKHSNSTKEKMSIAHRNHVVTKETRIKMRQARLGKSSSLKGKTFEEFYGIKEAKRRSILLKGDNNPARRLEIRKKISAAKIKDHKEHPERMKGRNNPNWRGGISNTPYPFEFNEELKEFIRKRDNYTCQFCGEVEKENKLLVHHIDYVKKNLNRDNLIALCRRCNSKVNFNRERWKEYFKLKNILK